MVTRHTIKNGKGILLGKTKKKMNRMTQNVRKFQTSISRNILSNQNNKREQKLMLNANKKKHLEENKFKMKGDINYE